MNKCNDDWTSKDKWIHLIVCLFLSIIHPCIGIILAIGKEFIDLYFDDNNHFCFKDIAYDFIGIAIGSLIFILIHYSIWNLL